MKLYLCGKMTGVPEYNFPAFHKAAANLRSAGHEVLNPAEIDGGDTTKPWEYYMRKDLLMLLLVEAIAVLPGWETSRGANLEVTVGRALKLPILNADDLSPYHETITMEANRLVGGDRQGDYGHPYHDFQRIAKFWSVILEADVTPQKVALCQIAVKMSREMNRPKRDNATDMAGYAQCLDLVNNFKPA
jgi:hypothetical protein